MRLIKCARHSARTRCITVPVTLHVPTDRLSDFFLPIFVFLFLSPPIIAVTVIRPSCTTRHISGNDRLGAQVRENRKRPPRPPVRSLVSRAPAPRRRCVTARDAVSSQTTRSCARRPHGFIARPYGRPCGACADAAAGLETAEARGSGLIARTGEREEK